MSNMYVLKKEGFEEAKINQALEMLLVDRKNEFRELSNMVLPKITNWTNKKLGTVCDEFLSGCK